MDLGVFFNVVVPLIEMDKASLIMISTPVDAYNFYSRLLQLKDPAGNDVFLKYEADLVCPRCWAGPRPQDCRHRLRLLPRWKSRRKMDVVALILEGQLQTLLRESMGMVTEETGGALSPYVPRLLEREPWRPDGTEFPKYVLTACDPNAEDSPYSSKMALVSLTHARGQFTVSATFPPSSSDACGAMGRAQKWYWNRRRSTAASHVFGANAP